MDEFKPEDELKPDPSDRRTGRSRQSSDRDSEPQINFDDVDLDADDRRPARARKPREDEEYEDDDVDSMDEEREERRPRKRKKAAAAKPASRQYMMIGLGILVLIVLIIGIGSALKAPVSKNTDEQTASTEKNIDLSGNAGNTGNAGSAADQANATQPAPGTTSAEQTAGASRDVTLPPISSTPTEAQAPATPEGQQRVEVQGNLNNALTQPESQNQLNNVAVNSTLPTEPATVAPLRNGSAKPAEPAETTRHTAPRTTTERKQAVIEPKPQTPRAEPKAVPTQPKRSETVASAPVKTQTPAPTVTQPKVTTSAPAKPAASAPAATAAAPAASGGNSTGNVGSLKSAPASHYTLQLSSSSNYNNLNAWAKKENLKNFVVYQTSRNGQPWYVLVTGVYASKDEAKRAVSTLPADVQAKNPWAKPLHQVQADLK
ncbi:cell division protein DamX [Enterobacter sp.]|uniref:cell division protein DamX n=1 Tax=Enterobacter sp. TaxID=42895 RepID=UPI00296ED7A1|nr:cell division protein DamX [Enterobacter sp.]